MPGVSMYKIKATRCQINCKQITYSHRVWIQDTNNQFHGTESKPGGASKFSSGDLHTKKQNVTHRR